MPMIRTDEWYKKRREWLEDIGSNGEILIDDEDGREYVMVERETMDEGENETWGYRRVYLPIELQKEL